MPKYICQYCGKELVSKYSLSTHKKTAKYCLKLRSIPEETPKYFCRGCEKNFTTKQAMDILCPVVWIFSIKS